jgi:membrane protease YdiL (CAAX protease family)
MINSIKETYKDFTVFLKRPVCQQDPIQTWRQKAKILFSLLAIDILIMVILVAVISGIEELGLVNMENHQVMMFVQQYSVWEIFLLMVVIVPFIEELIFRLYLRFKYNYLARLIILLASVAGKQNKTKIETYLTNFWASRFKGIFYLSAIIFGFVHLANFEYSIPLLLLSPILVAPQFIGGLFFGYLRVKYTLALGYFMHAIHNAIFILVPLIFMSGAIEKLTIKNNDYSLRIEEPTFGANKSVSSIYTDSVSFKGTRLKSIIALLLEKDESLIETNNNQIVEKKINLNFKKYSKDSSDYKKIILKHLSQVYNFNLESTKKKQETFELYVQDSLLLTKYKSKIIGKSINIISLKEIKIENSDLTSVANILTSSYKIDIFNTNKSTERFDFIIPKKDFSELEKTLSSKYGLSLKKTQKEIEHTHINFSKAK